jgi:RNA-directed DNA polymerase
MMDLYYDLIDNKYEIGRSICFIITRPKPREVWAADFRNRIVHHLIYNKFFHTFTKSFAYDSYACLPNKGTLNAAKRLKKFLRSCSQNYTKKTYFLKADIKNFFMTINKDILFGIICKKVSNPWWQNLIHKILYNDCKAKVIVKLSKKLLKFIPQHKSLFNANEKHGLPIGNLSSQFFANIYLDELDQYIKRNLKCKYYIRYVDDIVILDQNPQKLNQVYDSICSFVNLKLQIEFHEKKNN